MVNQKTKKKPEYLNYAVAFIDILGQKEHFKKLEKLYYEDPGSPEMFDEAHKVYADTIVVIQELYKQFLFFFETANSEKISDRKIISRFRFTDTIIASVPLTIKKEKSHAPEIFGMFSLLYSCGMAMLFSLFNKKPFRGGISFGLGVEIDKNEVYGPVSYRAYELESNIAQYPRVVVSKELVEYITYIWKNSDFETVNHIDTLKCKGFAHECWKLIRQDYDGIYIIDYLNDTFREINKIDIGERDYAELINGAFSFINSNWLKFDKENNKKLFQRYTCLRNYFLNSSMGDKYIKPK